MDRENEVKCMLRKSKFIYQQHAERMIVDILTAYPSLKNAVEEYGKAGARKIYIGNPAKNNFKPQITIQNGAIILHP